MFFYGPLHMDTRQPTKIYIHQLCVATGCILEDLPRANDERERERERERDSMLWVRLDDDDDDDYPNFLWVKDRVS